MQDYLITALLVLALAATVLYKVKFYPDGNPHFFDINNTKALRGFWCIVVILVHIPHPYQNTIQDAVGSFAYIGVTFFFLTSAYGLASKQLHRHGKPLYFWRMRLPKLLVPQLVVNILSVLLCLLSNTAVTVKDVLRINQWVVILMVCYLLLWCTNAVISKEKLRVFVLCVSVAAFSLFAYFTNTLKIIAYPMWPTEVWGFIWGCLLSVILEKLYSFMAKKWWIKCVLICGVSLILGLLYLKTKYVFFWGAYLLKILLGISITMFVLHLNSKFALGNRIVLFLGEISYEIYLIHTSIITLVSVIWGELSSGLFILFSLFGTILLSYVCHQISRFILKHIYRLAWFNVNKH